MAKILSTDELLIKNFEPQQQHRFIVYVDGIPSYLIKGFDKPKLSINPVTLNQMNQNRKIAGKSNWEDVSFTLVDAINPSGAQAIMKWMRLAYEVATGRAGYSDFYKKEITVNQFGPVGDVVQEWVLNGAWINNADWGNVDWDSDEPVNIAVTLSIDSAILNY